MKIGLQIPNFTWPSGPAHIGRTLGDIARAADAAGFSSLWTMDHFFQIPPVGPAETDMLEGYSTLSYLAALTSRVRLGTMVTGVPYRYPGVLVKTVTTLDVLSGGRAWLGIGAAWFDREAVGLGTAWPPLGTRFELLEEALQIAKQMWSDDNGPYEGKHNQLAHSRCRGPTRRSWSPAAARKRRSASSPNMPTPATCSAGRSRWSPSWTY